MRKRTRARKVVLMALYQVDLLGGDALPAAREFIRRYGKNEEIRNFSLNLLQGCRDRQAEIDEVITAIASNWKISRMAAIDRNILRLGTYEIMYRPDIPKKVSINEAIELGKEFGDASSGLFINGILDKIPKPGEPDEAAESAPPTQEQAS